MNSSARLISSLTLGACLVSSTLSAQQKITTMFKSDNWGGNGWGNYFDIDMSATTSPKSIEIFQIDINSIAPAKFPVAIDIYITSGSYVGKDSMATAWVKVATGTGVSHGTRDQPTIIKLNDSITLTGASTVFSCTIPRAPACGIRTATRRIKASRMPI